VPSPNIESHKTEKLPYLDWLAQTRWGQYVIGVEEGVFNRCLPLAGKPAVAVDIGCGIGRWTKQLSDLGWKVYGVDVDAQALEICRSRVPEANCLLVSPTSTGLPVESNSASLALCIEVAPALEANWFLPELQRVTRDGALFIGIHVNRRSWRGMACRLKYWVTGSAFADVYYLTEYPAWKKRLEEAGFDVVHEEGFCWAPFQRDSDSVLVPFFNRVERMMGLGRLVGISPWVVFVARKRGTVKLPAA